MQEVGLTSGLRRSHMPRSNYAHAPWLLSPRSRARGATTAEPRHLRACTLQLLKPEHLEPVLCNDRHHHSEKPMHPCPPRPEKAMRRHEDPVQPKLKINKSFQIKRQRRWYPHLIILRWSKQTGNWEIPAQWKKNPLSQYTVSKQLGLESRFHSVFSITCYSKIGI